MKIGRCQASGVVPPAPTTPATCVLSGGADGLTHRLGRPCRPVASGSLPGLRRPQTESGGRSRKTSPFDLVGGYVRRRRRRPRDCSDPLNSSHLWILVWRCCPAPQNLAMTKLRSGFSGSPLCLSCLHPGTLNNLSVHTAPKRLIRVCFCPRDRFCAAGEGRGQGRRSAKGNRNQEWNPKRFTLLVGIRKRLTGLKYFQLIA